MLPIRYRIHPVLHRLVQYRHPHTQYPQLLFLLQQHAERVREYYQMLQESVS
jgi:hypothetical protein